MSKQLASRNTHFAAQIALPGPIVAMREQRAGVEINGVVALYSGMSPHERTLAEKAITDRRYGQRTLPSGKVVYVITPPAPESAPQPKYSKAQHAVEQAQMIAALAAMTKDMPRKMTKRERANGDLHMRATKRLMQEVEARW